MNQSSSGEEQLLRAEQAYPTPYANSYLLPLLLVSLAAQKHTPKTKKTFKEEYDYIVVGAGSAGSVVAGRLSEESCVTVLLLEAGKSPPRLTEIPAIARHYANTDIDWQYLTAPLRWTGTGHIDNRIPWPSGKAVGGSSIWNAMLYVRGNRKNYNQWDKMGAKGWSYKDVLPYFKKLEDNTDPQYQNDVRYHAVGGPITVSKPTYYPVKKKALIEAIRKEGYDFVDSNAKKQYGFSDFQTTDRRGQRCSTAKGYLVPAENRTNLDILANAFVRKVLIEKKRATGVEFDFGGSIHRVRARKEVILSAGTTNSAQLLMLSGIGIISQLKKFNISVIADLPVGMNMQDHPAAILNFEVDDGLPQFDQDVSDDGNVQRYIKNRTGALTSADGILLLSYLSRLGNGKKDIPDYSLYFGSFSGVLSTTAGFTPQIFESLLPLSNKSLINCVVHLLHPYSRGTVTLQSADSHQQPLIDPNYYEDNRDVRDMVDGLKVCMKIVENPEMKKIGAKPVDILIPGCEEFVKDMDLYLTCMVRTIVLTTNHQVGTAKMGDPLDPTTVVDPQLRVKGICGLRVVDASVMPTVPWSNTNIPTIMVAEKASDLIKKTIKCRG